MQLVVYLFFNGNCEEAMNYYAEKMKGKITMMSRFGEAPMPAGEDWKNKVMHGVMECAGTRIMFSDSGEDKNITFGNNFSISIDCTSAEETDNLYKGFAVDGKVTMELQDTFWGARFGMAIDKFGIKWMFNHDKKAENS